MSRLTWIPDDALRAQQHVSRTVPGDLQADIAALRQQLARLEEAQCLALLAPHGSGGVATDSSVAAGARGVGIGGNATGNVITTGDHAQIMQIRGDIYLGQPSRDPEEALAIYRRVLVASTQQMALRGLDIGASDPTGSPQHFDLAQVYVDLQTTIQIPVETEARTPRQCRQVRAAAHETRPLHALEAVLHQRHTVLLGDPGSGKSTFLTHLGLCLAAHQLAPEQNWLARLRVWPWREADVVPVLIILRDFARWLPAGVQRAEARHLWQFITTRLAAQNLGFVAPALKTCLEQGTACLLLEGLDEIPTTEQRTFVHAAVTAFAQPDSYPKEAKGQRARRQNGPYGLFFTVINYANGPMLGLLCANRGEEDLSMAAEFGIFGPVEPAQIVASIFIPPTHPIHKGRLMRRFIAVTDVKSEA